MEESWNIIPIPLNVCNGCQNTALGSQAQDNHTMDSSWFDCCCSWCFLDHRATSQLLDASPDLHEVCCPCLATDHMEYCDLVGYPVCNYNFSALQSSSSTLVLPTIGSRIICDMQLQLYYTVSYCSKCTVPIPYLAWWSTESNGTLWGQHEQALYTFWNTAPHLAFQSSRWLTFWPRPLGFRSWLSKLKGRLRKKDKKRIAAYKEKGEKAMVIKKIDKHGRTRVCHDCVHHNQYCPNTTCVIMLYMWQSCHWLNANILFRICWLIID